MEKMTKNVGMTVIFNPETKFISINFILWCANLAIMRQEQGKFFNLQKKKKLLSLIKSAVDYCCLKFVVFSLCGYCEIK